MRKTQPSTDDIMRRRREKLRGEGRGACLWRGFLKAIRDSVVSDMTRFTSHGNSLGSCSRVQVSTTLHRFQLSQLELGGALSAEPPPSHGLHPLALHLRSIHPQVPYACSHRGISVGLSQTGGAWRVAPCGQMMTYEPYGDLSFRSVHNRSPTATHKSNKLITNSYSEYPRPFTLHRDRLTHDARRSTPTPAHERATHRRTRSRSAKTHDHPAAGAPN